MANETFTNVPASYWSFLVVVVVVVVMLVLLLVLVVVVVGVMKEADFNTSYCIVQVNDRYSSHHSGSFETLVAPSAPRLLQVKLKYL